MNTSRPDTHRRRGDCTLTRQRFSPPQRLKTDSQVAAPEATCLARINKPLLITRLAAAYCHQSGGAMLALSHAGRHAIKKLGSRIQYVRESQHEPIRISNRHFQSV